VSHTVVLCKCVSEVIPVVFTLLDRSVRNSAAKISTYVYWKHMSRERSPHMSIERKCLMKFGAEKAHLGT
jgi:hypothetical protein